MNLIVIKGYAADFPLQTYLRGGGGAAAYAAGDTLAADVYHARSTVTVFNPAIVWNTAGNTQTGYQQGQVLVSISAAQAALLEVSGGYTLALAVYPVSDPSKVYPIGRILLIVEPIAFP